MVRGPAARYKGSESRKAAAWPYLAPARADSAAYPLLAFSPFINTPSWAVSRQPWWRMALISAGSSAAWPRWWPCTHRCASGPGSSVRGAGITLAAGVDAFPFTLGTSA